MNIKYLILPWNANKKPLLLQVPILHNQFFICLFIIFISAYAVVTCKLFIHWNIRYQIKYKVTFLPYFIFISQDYPIINKKGRQYLYFNILLL
jgi:hypothetical protein